MSGKQQYTPEEIVTALKANQGLVFLAADSMGCTGQTIYNYAKRYKIVRDAMHEHKERRKDRAELSLYNAVNKGEAWAVCFFLKTQAKDRGYVERQEVTGADGGNIEVKLVRDD